MSIVGCEYVEDRIYKTPAGKFKTVLNVPVINPKTGKLTYKKPEKTHTTLPAARKWRNDHDEKHGAFAPIGDRYTLSMALSDSQPEREKYKKWQAFQRCREGIKKCIGLHADFAAFTETEADQFREWVLEQRCMPRSKDPKQAQSVQPLWSNSWRDWHFKEWNALVEWGSSEKGFFDGVPPRISLINQTPVRELEMDLDDYISVVNRLPMELHGKPAPRRAFMLAALNTGARKNQFLRIRKNHVKTGREGKLFIEIQPQKGGERVNVPVCDFLRPHIDFWLKQYPECPWLFPNPKYMKPFSEPKKAITTACRNAGVPTFTMHHIRHLATVLLLDVTNGNLEMVQKIVGWSDTVMVRRYGHLGYRHHSAFEKMDEVIAEKGLEKVVGLENHETLTRPNENVVLFPGVKR